MNLTALIAAVLLIGIMGGTALSAPEEGKAAQTAILSTEISGSDLVYFTGAARKMALITWLSQLAKERAATPEVLALARAVWKDQTDAAARLKALAGRRDVPVPEEPDGQGKKVLETLGGMKGVKFDKSYIDALTDTLNLLETSMQAGAASSDKEIKAFAQSGLGMVKMEKEQVRRLGM
jgi:putative membrane protein